MVNRDLWRQLRKTNPLWGTPFEATFVSRFGYVLSTFCLEILATSSFRFLILSCRNVARKNYQSNLATVTQNEPSVGYPLWGQFFSRFGYVLNTFCPEILATSSFRFWILFFVNVTRKNYQSNLATVTQKEPSVGYPLWGQIFQSMWQRKARKSIRLAQLSALGTPRRRAYIGFTNSFMVRVIFEEPLRLQRMKIDSPGSS